MNNLISQDYLMHHGVKGMKWGVRHDKQPLGQRYSDYVRNKSNKRYDRLAANIEARRKKRIGEVGPLSNTRYGKWVKKKSNQNYDKALADIESRRKNKMRELDEFDKTRNKLKSIDTQKVKKAAIIGGAAVAAGLSIYGGYKLKQTRDYNKASIAKYLADENPAAGLSVLKGEPYKYYGSHNMIDGGKHILSTIDNAKIKNSIKGPSLNVSISTVKGVKGKNAILRPYVSKELVNKTIGNKGTTSLMGKEQMKYWRDYYNKTYKRR